MSAIESKDFFRDDELVDDPYPYLTTLRSKCPVRREPHHDVVMVTGYDEALAVLGDATTFSSCTSVTGPFPGFPVPLEGDDVSELIERTASAPDERPDPDARPADPHRPPRAADAADHAEAPQGERGVHVAARRPPARRVPDRGRGEFIGEFAGPFSLLVIADLLGVPEEDHDEFAAVLWRRPGRRRQHRRRHRARPRSTSTEFPPTSRTGARAARRRAHRLPPPRSPTARRPRSSTSCAIAANLFAAGQETTVRLLGSALQIIAEDPSCSSCCATSATASRTSSRRRCGSRARSRATSACRASRRPSAASTSRPAPR